MSGRRLFWYVFRSPSHILNRLRLPLFLYLSFSLSLADTKIVITVYS